MTRQKLIKWLTQELKVFTLFLSVCFPLFISAQTAVTVYCYQGECLYCNEDDGCWVVRDDSSTYHKISHTAIKPHRSTTIRSSQKAAPVYTMLPVSKPLALRYSPILSVAQYALHQGDARSANLIEGFIPLNYHNPFTIGFINFRYYNPNGTPVEYNGDIGFRHLFHENNRLFGLYGGYDRYRSNTSRYFSQLHAGVEYWIKRCFIGGNIYLPVGTKAYSAAETSSNEPTLIPTNIPYRYNIGFVAQGGEERILPGADAEIGIDLTHRLTTYFGGYYFDHRDVPRVLGPKLRATYTFYHRPYHHLLGLFDRIRLEGLLSHDSVRGTSWYAGLRASIALHANPTHRLFRHMVDPLRRDMNVVDDNTTYRTVLALYQIDGRPARVDLVDGVSGRNIDDAVKGSPGTPADIIGVRGSRTANDVLVPGDRNLTVTGGPYSFVFDGQPYTIEQVGNSGQLTAAPTATKLWALDGDKSVTLQHLTMNGDSSQFLLRNGPANQSTGGNSFNLTMEYITGNAPIDLTLNVANATGTLYFNDNQITVNNSSATNMNADVTGTAIVGLALIEQGSTESISVESFLRNNIQMLNNTSNNSVALLTQGDRSLTTAMVLKNLNYNTLTASHNIDGFGWVLLDNYVTITDSLTENHFNALSNASNGTGWEIASSNVTVSNDMSDNTFNVSNNSNSGRGWFTSGDSTLTIDGNITRNTMNASGNTSGSGVGWLFTLPALSPSIITINGDIFENNFTASLNSSTGFGWRTASAPSFTINGMVRNNNMTIDNNGVGPDSNAGISIVLSETQDFSFEQAVQDNAFLINNNLSGNYGFILDASVGGTITFEANTQGNLISLNNNAAVSESMNGIVYNG